MAADGSGDLQPGGEEGNDFHAGCLGQGIESVAVEGIDNGNGEHAVLLLKREDPLPDRRFGGDELDDFRRKGMSSKIRHPLEAGLIDEHVYQFLFGDNSHFDEHFVQRPAARLLPFQSIFERFDGNNAGIDES